MQHKGTLTLTTERLTLRRFELDDAEAMYTNWASDERVTRFLTWTPHASVAVSRSIISEWIGSYENAAFYQWAIVVRERHELIGSIGVVALDEAMGMCEIGYCIGVPWWHQGLMSEALAAVINYLFDEVEVQRIQSNHDANNPRSGHVMAACGMHYEGTLRGAARNNQGIADICMYGLLSSDRNLGGIEQLRAPLGERAFSYQDINAATIDRWVAEGWEWGKPIDHATYVRAEAGDWTVQLTPTKPVPDAWLGDLRGKRVLGLASGGGQQGPLFAAAGAKVTILDYSESQLASERLVAEREGYEIELVRADMTQGLPFEDASFDLVFNPVSICYIREVEPLWREVARVLVPGGSLLTGFDTIVNYLVDRDEERIVWAHPFDPCVDPVARAFLEADDAGMQFGHSLTETLGGIVGAGLTITDIYEDTNGEGRLHDLRIPSYLALCAHK